MISVTVDNFINLSMQTFVVTPHWNYINLFPPPHLNCLEEGAHMRRHNILFFHCFSEKIRLDVSSESSATRQRIHMKNQALFSLKDKINKTCHRDRIAHLTATCPSHKQL